MPIETCDHTQMARKEIFGRKYKNLLHQFKLPKNKNH
jgi:hypothetical protein